MALEVTQHHHCHILLVKVITKVCPGRQQRETQGMSRSCSDIKTEVHQAHIVRIPCGKWYFCDGHGIEATILWPSLENKICHMKIFFSSIYLRSQIPTPTTIIINKFLFGIFHLKGTIFWFIFILLQELQDVHLPSVYLMLGNSVFFWNSVFFFPKKIAWKLIQFLFCLLLLHFIKVNLFGCGIKGLQK